MQCVHSVLFKEFKNHDPLGGKVHTPLRGIFGGTPLGAAQIQFTPEGTYLFKSPGRSSDTNIII